MTERVAEPTVMVPFRLLPVEFCATWYCRVPLPVPLVVVRVIHVAVVDTVQAVPAAAVTDAVTEPPPPNMFWEVGETLVADEVPGHTPARLLFTLRKTLSHALR